MPRLAADADAASFETCWRRLDVIYDWASMAADLALRGDQGDAFARTNLEVRTAERESAAIR